MLGQNVAEVISYLIPESCEEKIVCLSKFLLGPLVQVKFMLAELYRGRHCTSVLMLSGNSICFKQRTKTLEANTPVSTRGHKCIPWIAETPFNAPDSITDFAPASPSSAGWKSKSTVPANSLSLSFSSLAAALDHKRFCNGSQIFCDGMVPFIQGHLTCVAFVQTPYRSRFKLERDADCVALVSWKPQVKYWEKCTLIAKEYHRSN